jgi:hypothetical protein
MRLIVAAILVAFAGTVALAKTKLIPAEVQAIIDDDIKSCTEKVTFKKGFLTRRDINGDGIEDFILDYGRFSCGENSIAYCGSAGCLMTVFASLPNEKFAKVLDENVRSVDFKNVRGRPAMLLQLHGSACGKIGSEPCGATLHWNGEKFAPAN